MKYEHLWADMHSNIHHNQMQDLDRWYQHAKQVMDFWPIAYYPFAIRRTPTGGELEDLVRGLCAGLGANHGASQTRRSRGLALVPRL